MRVRAALPPNAAAPPSLCVPLVSCLSQSPTLIRALSQPARPGIGFVLAVEILCVSARGGNCYFSVGKESVFFVVGVII